MEGVNNMKYIITDDQLDLIDNADMIGIIRLPDNKVRVEFYGKKIAESFILQGHEQVCVLTYKGHALPDVSDLIEELGGEEYDS